MSSLPRRLRVLSSFFLLLRSRHFLMHRSLVFRSTLSERRKSPRPLWVARGGLWCSSLGSCLFVPQQHRSSWPCGSLEPVPFQLSFRVPG